MRCARCNRTLNTAYLTIGTSPFGPKCADRMGLSTTKQKRTRKVKRSKKGEPDEKQFALELEWMP